MLFFLEVTMSAIQLEFNLNNLSAEAVICSQIQESVRKMQKKLFCEVSTLKKENGKLQFELALIKEDLRKVKGESVEWEYLQNEKLFDIKVINQ